MGMHSFATNKLRAKISHLVLKCGAQLLPLIVFLTSGLEIAQLCCTLVLTCLLLFVHYIWPCHWLKHLFPATHQVVYFFIGNVIGQHAFDQSVRSFSTMGSDGLSARVQNSLGLIKWNSQETLYTIFWWEGLVHLACQIVRFWTYWKL